MPIDITLTGGAGEYMESATFVGWSVESGAEVRQGEVLATVETAKAATDIEAPCDGVLVERLATAGEEIAVGRVIGRITAPGEAATSDQPPAAVESGTSATALDPEQVGSVRSDRRPIASPLARRLAAERGIRLDSVVGTGPGGRIKARDLEKHVTHPSEPAAEHTQSTPRMLSRRTGTAPLVLLHGFGSNAATWNLFLPRLGSLRRFALELPGHGRQTRSGVNFSDLVSSVVQDLEHLGLGAVHLVGHSLGGAVAAAVAHSGSFETRSLTLLAPAGLGPEINSAFVDGFTRATTAEGLQPWLDLLVADAAHLPGNLAGMVLRERRTGISGGGLLRQAAALFPDGTQGFSVKPLLDAPPFPTKAVWGRRDRIIPVEHTVALGGAVGVHVLPSVGHLPYLEAPDLVARLVVENVRSGET